MNTRNVFIKKSEVLYNATGPTEREAWHESIRRIISANKSHLRNGGSIIIRSDAKILIYNLAFFYGYCFESFDGRTLKICR